MNKAFYFRVLQLGFAPAVQLVSRLSYVRKFILATALFALPLAFILVAGLLQHHQIIQGLERKYVAMERVAELDSYAEKAARLRNDNTLAVILNDSDAKTNAENLSEELLAFLSDLASKEPVRQSNLVKLYINNLVAQISTASNRGGSEGDTTHTAYSKFNQVMSQIHRLTVLILTEGGSYNDHDAQALNAISLLVNDFNQPLEDLGESEILGAFFLEKGFVDTKGILSLTEISRKLTESFEILTQQLEVTFRESNSANRTSVIDISLLEAIPLSIALIEDTIIFDDELLTSKSIFRMALQKETHKLYQLRSQVVRYLLLNYEQRIANFKQKQIERLLLIGGLIALSLYVFLGVFFSVDDSLHRLTEFAKRIEDGDLDSKVELDTRDEFYQLAGVLENMRLRLKVRERELYDLTITDGLTGIYNRKHFNESLDKGVSHTRRTDTPLSLLLIDIDHFKKFNDEHGHQVGDDCLIHMGQLLRENLTRKTDQAYRYGGEEFAILLPHTDSEGAAIMAKKIWGAIRSTTLVTDGKKLDITASIGVATLTGKSKWDTAESLIFAADQALYKAKEQGRDQFLLAESIQS